MLEPEQETGSPSRSIAYSTVDLLSQENNLLKQEIARLRELAIEWQDGYPKQHYFKDEWFLAETKCGPCVLKSLPEGQSYEFTTADHTYISKEFIVKWALLPDSQWKREFAQSMTERTQESK